MARGNPGTQPPFLFVLLTTGFTLIMPKGVYVHGKAVVGMGEPEGGDPLVDAMAEALNNAEMPDLKAIICAFTRKCGGADGIARMLMREYKAAKPGTMIRSMILQMILQGSKAISAKVQSRDESMLSDEDLDREVKVIMENVRKTGKYSGPSDGIQPT